MGIRTGIKTSITTSIRTSIEPFPETKLRPYGGKARKFLPPKQPQAAFVGGSRRRFAGARGTSAIRNTIPGQQRCSVRCSYVSNGSSGHWRQHGIYLEREGAQKQGEKGAGFDAHGTGVSVAHRLAGWQNEGDERMFKLIISPEFGKRVDLQDFTRGFVKQLEVDLGTKLEWVAVDHYNTEFPHVHVALRGRDDLGEALSMHPGYIKEGMRQRAQEQMTERLGYRTEHDEYTAKLREVGLTRFTSLDKELVKRANEDFELVLRAPTDMVSLRRNNLLRDRLTKLEEMGFAERQGMFKNQWRLHPSLEEALRRLTRTKDKQKALAKHQAFILDKHAPLVNTVLKPGGWLVGRVLGAGLDEGSDKLYAMLEGADGKVHYVLHDFKLESSEAALVPGQVAVLECPPESADKALTIAQYADIPEHVVDRLVRSRFFRDLELEQPVGTLDTFANRARRLMLQRFDELTRLGTIARWDAKRSQSKERAKSKAFVMDDSERDGIEFKPLDADYGKTGRL
ncbi:DUF3363 domain-containing protein [Ramlibacter alkalitolerans]|uniref:Relaxase/mobilization nuclease domain-containing protein n=1 Tax=Ramlibacter alkalitolerans TaxID=2039631 RepID=A0ABS1JU63_9BURK|nr:DUF3363 domain-containing protein [Ramlibacter alkalitolerans]MBL0427788.1 relaxase/mobilization nuclease domain-containing protein [Ramlibacter alkalitolerans]